MSKQVYLKLVGAERYACPLIGDDVVERGQVVAVSEEAAEALKAEKRYDALNNEHDIFNEVDGPQEVGSADDEGEGEGEGDEGDETPVLKAPARAARSAKK